MLRTNIEVWRISLLMSLGWSAASCGGAAHDGGITDEPSGSDATDDAPGGDVADDPVEGTGMGPVYTFAPPQSTPSAVADHLRCNGARPLEADSRLMQCDNGIVYRPLPPNCFGDCAATDFSSTSYDLCGSSSTCNAGTLCIQSFDYLGCSAMLGSYFACQTPNDTCGSDEQCSVPGERCLVVRGEHHCRVPVPVMCVPGRPFLVEGVARTASLRTRSDWCGTKNASLCGLSPRARAAAAAHWQAAALLEHASIAAFARFALQLLELGAPFELCRRSQQAMLDETEHARLCFALASRYAGRELGPTNLALDGALAGESLSSVVRLTFREGCVGETCAALEAAEALAAATDPAVRAALERISRDEQSHAELAFRFVAWALETDTTGELRAVLRLELATLRQEQDLGLRQRCNSFDHAKLGIGRSKLELHGVLGATRSRALRHAAVDRVVLPCAERMLTRADEQRAVSDHGQGLRAQGECLHS